MGEESENKATHLEEAQGSHDEIPLMAIAASLSDFLLRTPIALFGGLWNKQKPVISFVP